MLPSSQNIGRVWVWVWVGEAESLVLVQGFHVWPWAGQGLALSKKCFSCLRPGLCSQPLKADFLSSPEFPGLDRKRPERPQNSSRKRLWLFGTREGQVGGTRRNCGLLPPSPYSYSPFPEGYMRHQCRARPSLQALGWTQSLLGGEQEWEKVWRQPLPGGGSE